MSLNLPAHGDVNWDTKLNVALSTLDATATSLNAAVSTLNTLIPQLQASLDALRAYSDANYLPQAALGAAGGAAALDFNGVAVTGQVLMQVSS